MEYRETAPVRIEKLLVATGTHPWITDDVKETIQRKQRVYRKYVKRGRKPDDWARIKLKSIQQK